VQVERESSVVSLKKGRAGLAVAASAQDLGDLSTGESCRRSDTESVFEKSLKETKESSSGGIVPLVHCGDRPSEVHTEQRW
jgi:hypothetical protein